MSGSMAPTGREMAETLERGEVIFLERCPIALPVGDDMEFLLQQRLASRAHKNISYNPHTGRTGGFHRQSPAQAGRLQGLLAAFSQNATAWLSSVLPDYARGWRLDQVSYRPEEEATRRLRLKARNDLLHVDAFPTRPTNGRRILRFFVNVNPKEPRVWITSDPFPKLLERYGAAAGLPDGDGPGVLGGLRERVVRLFHPGRAERTPYDAFMLRLHDYLKANDTFQEHGPKRFWSFPPGSSWLCLTDTASHAVLRGRFALEHSYFIAPETLALPDEAPAAFLERACGHAVLRRAA